MVEQEKKKEEPVATTPVTPATPAAPPPPPPAAATSSVATTPGVMDEKAQKDMVKKFIFDIRAKKYDDVNNARDTIASFPPDLVKVMAEALLKQDAFASVKDEIIKEFTDMFGEDFFNDQAQVVETDPIKNLAIQLREITSKDQDFIDSGEDINSVDWEYMAKAYYSAVAKPANERSEEENIMIETVKDYGIVPLPYTPATNTTPVEDKVRYFLNKGAIIGNTYRGMANHSAIGFIEFIAQQINNVNSAGEFNKNTDFREQDPIKNMDQELKDYANQMFPEYSQIAEEADKQKVEPIETKEQKIERLEKELASITDDNNPRIAEIDAELTALEQTEPAQVTIEDNDKIIFGHPTIGKSFLRKKTNDFISLDDDYGKEITDFVDANRGTETRQEYKGRKPKEYNDFMLALYDRVKVQAEKEGKKLFVSNTNILKERMADFDKVITIPKDEFKKRFDARGATYGFEDWKSDIDATIAKVDPSKVITTTGYLSDLLPVSTPTTSGNITKEAEDLLSSITSGSKPTFITKNLEKIANDNGITVTNQMSADDVIDALRVKADR